MGTLLKLAWRNIWRNKRRTVITAASILFAVFFAVFMQSLQRGAWDNMINNVVSYYFGYGQVHQKGYWQKKSLDKAFEQADSLVAIIDAVPQVLTQLPRLESFALASSHRRTLGVMVVGISPSQEPAMTQLPSRITEGQYLAEKDKAVLVADSLAKRLGLTVGDTLVLVSQGYRGVNAAGQYPVKGLVHFGSPELNNMMVYLPLPEAQIFYGAEGLLTSIALNIGSQNQIESAISAIRSRVDTSAYEVMDWQELLPELVRAKALDSAGNYIVYLILYLIIAFGIFGTLLMMIKERQYEFGVLVALGMKRKQLSLVVWLEAVMLGVIGAIAGILVSLPVVWFFKRNPIRFSGDYADTMEKFGFEPIFPTVLHADIFMTQALIVFLLGAILAMYPVWIISKLEPVAAMRA